MSNHLKSSLLAATAAVVAVATPAHAQLAYPAAELRGAGASSVQDVFPLEANCYGGFKQNGTTSTNSFTVNADATVSARNLNINGALPTADGFACATASVQPNVSVRYIGTGSGTGRTLFVATSFPTQYATSVGGNLPNSVVFGSDASTWGGLHYALSDSPVSSGNLTSLASGRTGAGAWIQFPMYTLPVALVYSNTYAYKTSDNTPLNFDAQNITGVTGLRLSKVAYCNIVNGYIKNWNDSRIQATNWKVDAKGNAVISKTTKKPVTVALYDKTNDFATRWASEGAPIRLVGRLDKSGTTDIFVRHIANACTDSLGTSPNKFTAAAESLPFDSTGTIDLREYRPDTNYKPGVASSNFAGTTQTLNGLVYVNATTGFAGQSAGFTASEGVVVSANGTNGGGKFIVASGSGNVRTAILAAGTVPGALITSADGSLKFNGKIGYISADNVAFQSVVGAQLEVGATYANGTGKKPSFLAANAVNAVAAFGKTVLPPEGDKGGKYVAGGLYLRSNPLDWYTSLYAAGSSLANPAVGYPMTGTTQFNTATCFADPDNRNALVGLLTTVLGKNLLNSQNVKFSKNVFTGLKVLGVREQINIAPLNAAWTTAVYNTFLTKAKVEGSLNLYIQAGLPGKIFAVAKGLTVGTGVIAESGTTGATLPTTNPYNGTTAKTLTKSYTEAAPNPTCTTGGL